MTAFLAHRGRGVEGPENAIEALPGLPSWVDGVEVDARLSADGVAVLMHDARVDRTTDGRGEVASMSAAALAALSLAGGGRVPRLDAYLRACADLGLPTVAVDVKQDDHRTLAEVVRVIEASELVDRCVVMVRSIEGMERFRRLTSTLRLGGLGVTEANAHERIAGAAAHGAELLLLQYGDESYLSNRRALRHIRAAGLRAGASTINTLEALRAAVEDRCDLVLTDATSRRAPLTGRGR